jgi:uncharacterized protein (DUF2384 family)
MDGELQKLAKCTNLLKDVFGEVSIIMDWLEFPHPLLSNVKPRIAMVDGDIDSVIRILERMKNAQLS